mgnify:CR=1 FL=1
MANMNIEGTLGSMFKGMDGFISSKSVVGEPVYVGDTIIIPLVDVNFCLLYTSPSPRDCS